MYLAAESSRSFLPSALPGAIRTVDVMEPCDAAFNSKVTVIVHAQLL